MPSRRREERRRWRPARRSGARRGLSAARSAARASRPARPRPTPRRRKRRRRRHIAKPFGGSAIWSTDPYLASIRSSVGESASVTQTEPSPTASPPGCTPTPSRPHDLVGRPGRSARACRRRSSTTGSRRRTAAAPYAVRDLADELTAGRIEERHRVWLRRARDAESPKSSRVAAPIAPASRIAPRAPRTRGRAMIRRARGHTVRAAGPSAGSCARIARWSCCSSSLGSRPRSSRNVRRAC